MKKRWMALALVLAITATAWLCALDTFAWDGAGSVLYAARGEKDSPRNKVKRPGKPKAEEPEIEAPEFEEPEIEEPEFKEPEIEEPEVEEPEIEEPELEEPEIE